MTRSAPALAAAATGSRSLPIEVRLAVVADLHGNLPALEAAAKDLDAEAPDLVIVAGDLVNRGPMNAEVLSFVLDRGWSAVEGNHDTLVAEWIAGTVSPAWLTDPWYAPLAWVSDQLPQWHDYLASLPFEALLELDGVPPVKVVHASPRGTRDGIYASLDDAALEEKLGGAREPLFVCAHTHKPLDRHLDGQRVVNVGSVGVPFNGDPRAQYGLFTWSGRGTWQVQLKAVAYDRAPVREAFEGSGYLDAGTAARIFLHEYESARSCLYRFERWAEEAEVPKDDASWQLYLSSSSAAA